ncbi:phage holin family protein [Peribacillus sp. B-H-3]|uniref:phage holin family protein n=1 Tax=Peribacillus sp. B-H-3 TaxID=3400420 RepID=UPI003B011152
MNALFRFLVNGLLLMAIAWLLDSISVDSYITALIAIFILGIVNLIVRPVLHLISLPITILTFGLFSFVINAAAFYLTSYLVSGFEVTSFWGAFIGSLLLTLAQSILVKKDT